MNKVVAGTLLVLGGALTGCGSQTTATQTTLDGVAQVSEAAQHSASQSAVRAGHSRQFGKVLMHASSGKADVTTRRFKAARPGWKLHYTYDCSPTAYLGTNYFLVTGINDDHPSNQELGIAYAMGEKNGGTSDRIGAGDWQVRIAQRAGCVWHVSAIQQ